MKSFAKVLVTDHTDAYRELGELAQKLGAKIPRAGLDIAKNRVDERVIQMKGPSFDRGFVQSEISAQRQAIAEFRREAHYGSDAQVKASPRE